MVADREAGDHGEVAPGQGPDDGFLVAARCGLVDVQEAIPDRESPARSGPVPTLSESNVAVLAAATGLTGALAMALRRRAAFRRRSPASGRG